MRNYAGGHDAIASAFSPYLKHSLVKEGLEKIKSKFLSFEHLGPISIVDFLEIRNAEDRLVRQRIAFENVSACLRAIEIAGELP